MTIAGTRSVRGDMAASRGPAAGVDWIEIPGRDPEDRVLYALPDAATPVDQADDWAADGGGPRVLPRLHVVGAPELMVAPSSDAPMFGLTLMLERQPRVEELSLVPLITGGVVALTVSIIPSDAELEAASAGGRESARLFPRRTRWMVRHEDDGPPLAEADADGAGGVAALSTTISRADALAILGAVNGDASDLRVTCEVTFRAVPPPLPALQVTVDLAEAYEGLQRVANADRQITEADLLRVLASLLVDGSIEVHGVPPHEPTPDPADLVAAIRAGLLRALIPILKASPNESGGPLNYRLGVRPVGSGRMTFEQRQSDGGVDRSATFSRPLRDVVRHLVDSRPLDAFVRAVCPAADGTLQPVAVRVAAARGGLPGPHSSGLAATGLVVAEMPAIMRTSATVRANAQALAVSDIAIRPSGRLQTWAVNDLVLDLAPVGDRLQSLPMIDGDGHLWPDRLDGSQFWYAPEFSVVEPALPVTALTSPFVFSFRAVGHDAEGRPGLEATIRLTLHGRMSEAAAAAWEVQGRPTARPVPANGLSISLQVPYRDEHGQPALQVINAVDIGHSDADVVATFRFTDQWARLAYGALGVAGFQAEPAKVILSYIFPAYVPVAEGGGRIDWGGKIATIQGSGRLAIARPEDAARSVVHPVDARSGADDALLLSRARPMFATGRLTAHPAAFITVHPLLVAPVQVIRPKTYGIRTQGRTSEVDVLFPCATYGGLYVQAEDPSAGDTAGDQEIGCRDAWTLGQVQLRLYELVNIDVGVADPGFTVYRSLQVPGRFLVLPKAYTVTRFEPADTRAYRPALYMYSSVDAVHPERSSCIVMATLRPSVTPANRRALVDALRATLHPTPTLEWPTELAVDTHYQWAIATGGATSAQVVPAVAKTPEGFQVSLATGIDGILQLKAILETGGITAAVSFPLADGTSPQSTLVIDLGRIDGPWEAGAVDAKVSSGTATVTNRVERAADVGEILAFQGATWKGAITLERRLAAGESASVAVPADADTAVPRYALVAGPATIDEVRTFIEDIYTNVVFVSTMDLANAQLTALIVEARIVGVAGTDSATLDTTVTSVQIGFVLPLTTYLTEPTLQYRVLAKGMDGTPSAGAWHDWRLDLQGNVVEVNATS